MTDFYLTINEPDNGPQFHRVDNAPNGYDERADMVLSLAQSNPGCTVWVWLYRTNKRVLGFEVERPRETEK